jgi:hypothetical protein
MKCIIEIPTYWTTEKYPTYAIYDHPTPISQDGTLGRLLESLEKVDLLNSEIWIFPVPLVEEVIQKVKKLTENYDVNIFSIEEFERIKERLKGFPEDFVSHFRMEGYGMVRNFGLMLGSMLNADCLILLDDDEVVEDEDYVRKAIRFVGKERDGKIIGGIAGYYVGKDGSYKLKEKKKWWKYWWNKERVMNEAFRIIDTDELVETNFAFGGNMVIHSSLFKKVPFDPYNTRGEDIDFMLNAKHFGFSFLLDPELKVKHLPPERIAPYTTKMKQDIYRFFYQREKLKIYGISPESLDPYPGFFLRRSLGARAFLTSFLFGIDSMVRGNLEGVKGGFGNLRCVRDARKYAKICNKYLDFQREWEKFISLLLE